MRQRPTTGRGTQGPDRPARTPETEPRGHQEDDADEGRSQDQQMPGRHPGTAVRRLCPRRGRRPFPRRGGARAGEGPDAAGMRPERRRGEVAGQGQQCRAAAPSAAVPTNATIGRPSRCGAEGAADAPRSDTGALILTEEMSAVSVLAEMVHLAYRR